MPWPAAKLISFNGKSQSIHAWARELGCEPHTLTYRLQRWPLADALTTPPHGRRVKIKVEMVEAAEKVIPAEIKIHKSAYHYLEFREKRLPLCEWAKIVGINRPTLSQRLKLGWSPERALSEPVKKRTVRTRVDSKQLKSLDN